VTCTIVVYMSGANRDLILCVAMRNFIRAAELFFTLLYRDRASWYNSAQTTDADAVRAREELADGVNYLITPRS
jgi:hypothetical protein